MLHGQMDGYIRRYKINIEQTKCFELNNRTQVLWSYYLDRTLKVIYSNYDLSFFINSVM